MQAYHGADGIPGITSVTITYVGKDYEPSTTPPTNAGEYQVTAEFTAEDGYTVAPGPYTAKLIIKKAPQESPCGLPGESRSHLPDWPPPSLVPSTASMAASTGRIAMSLRT